MRLLNKHKRGFTLIELVLVIAIILILASVSAIAVNDILKTSQKGASSASQAVTNMKSKVTDEENDLKSKGF
ncbi:prepilin-type N-terminal cleavage/methylation domain-containing protein [Ruminococcaceae bacterium YRB3002]|nr:prepilin-type N-terminal cleavage/methylation domain-containing protein [Ruminococcaceae bacterium YRB3002]